MMILVCYHFGSFANFKHYYQFYIKQHLSGYFPDAVSYNRFVELMPRVFFHLMLFFIMNICAALAAYSFFDNKPEALPVHVEKSAQPTLF